MVGSRRRGATSRARISRGASAFPVASATPPGSVRSRSRRCTWSASARRRRRRRTRVSRSSSPSKTATRRGGRGRRGFRRRVYGYSVGSARKRPAERRGGPRGRAGLLRRRWEPRRLARDGGDASAHMRGSRGEPGHHRRDTSYESALGEFGPPFLLARRASRARRARRTRTAAARARAPR